MSDPIRHDLLAPEVRADPYTFYARLRVEDPVPRCLPLGFWMPTRYDDVVSVLQRTEDFSSTAMQNLALSAARLEGLDRPPATIISSDNPAHNRLRSIMQREFTPKRLARLSARVREIARELLADVREGAELDLVQTFTIPLPVLVIAEILGIEPERREDFKRWSDALVTTGAAGGEVEDLTQRQRVGGQVMELARYLLAMVDKRREEPRDDVISKLVRAEQEPGRISRAETLAYLILLLVAGNETTTNLIGNLTLALLDRPDQLEKLRARPELIPHAVEEGLRWSSPVQMLFRVAARDTELGGVRISKGDRVAACYAAANRDPARFPDPDRFDVERRPQGHLAFGYGLHFCLGANLARREACIALEELLPLLPRLRRTHEQVEWVASWFLRGPRSLRFMLGPATGTRVAA